MARKITSELFRRLRKEGLKGKELLRVARQPKIEEEVPMLVLRKRGRSRE